MKTKHFFNRTFIFDSIGELHEFEVVLDQVCNVGDTLSVELTRPGDGDRRVIKTIGVFECVEQNLELQNGKFVRNEFFVESHEVDDYFNRKHLLEESRKNKDKENASQSIMPSPSQGR